MEPDHNNNISSPEYIKTSLASAIGLRFRSGRFYRDAKPFCINLLLSYPDNCYANCAYCGLARSRPQDNGEKSFIRVDWPVLKTKDVIERLEKYQSNIRRVCVSMVTHKNAVSDTFGITKQIAQCCSSPISVLITPNLMNREYLVRLKETGADTVGIGLDAASKRVFELTRGKKVNGGLVWEKYWEVLEDAVDVFGREKISCHIMVGIGETDRELVEIFFKLRKCGALAHLFSFYPEPDSTMSLRNRPSLRRFRRIQLVCHLIENEIIKEKHLSANF
ncbi:MAG: radical SAM protein [Planctomycetota bacterium]